MHTVPTGQNIGPSIFSPPQDYFLFPAQDSTTGHHVEQLELYARLNNQWSGLASVVVDAIPATDTLVQGITELKAEIQRLKAGEGSLHYPDPQTESRNHSIAPNDSISCVHRMPSPSVVASTHYAGGTALRPSHYPQSILWTMQDAMPDPHIVFTPARPSRIPMALALRHENGGLVDVGLYKVIRATGESLVQNMLFKSIPRASASQNRPHTKKLLMEVCKDTWHKAVHQYETEHPLLGLCEGHWKAEQMLGFILSNKTGKPKGRSKTEQSLVLATDESDTEACQRVTVLSPPPSLSAHLGEATSKAPSNTGNTEEGQVGEKRPRTNSSAANQSGLPRKKSKISSPHNTGTRKAVKSTSTKPHLSLCR